MRKVFYLSLSMLCCLALLLPSIANAHPGRTDSNGGHTCHTNCEKWGLESGEYHYHNGGGSSKSNSESNSNSDSNSSSESNSSSGSESNSESNSNSNSGSNSNSSSGSESNSGSNSNSNSTSESIDNKPITEEPKAKPKIDKKQVQADEHYKNAVNYFEKEKFQKALEELDKIYDLDRDDNKSDKLMENSLTSMYELAKEKLDNEEYEKAKELLDFILDFPHSNKKIIEKSKELLENVSLLEQISLLLSEAKTANENKEYEDALSFINEARDLKDIEEISGLFDIIINDILDEAKSTYSKNEFEKSTNLYALLEKHAKSSELKKDYQATILQIETLQIIQEEYELETIDFEQDSLFNHLLDNNEDQQNPTEIVNHIKSYITQNEQDKVQFIFDIDINELATGGQ